MPLLRRVRKRGYAAPRAAFWGVAALLSLGTLVALSGRIAKGAKPMDLNAGLLGHWPLSGDSRDYSGHQRHALNHGVDLAAKGPNGRASTAAAFNGRNSWLEVPAERSPRLGTGDFSIAVWIDTDAHLDDIPGDLLSQYDPSQRRGFHLGLVSLAGVTSTQPNVRNVHFGIDNGHVETWQDCGRPGNALFICALAVYNGALYAGTFETGADEAGHVYCYEGGTTWTDCGSPDRSNAVMCLAVHQGRLYAGTARYRARGSLLPESPNQNPGGVVYRYEGGQKWMPCGRLPEANEVYALCVYQGSLYAIPMYSPGVFRLEENARWVPCGIPGDQRSMALAVYDGHLYATGNGGAGVWRYRGGTEWEDCGKQASETQTYSLAIYRGRLYAGTWPSGSVFRYEGGTQWSLLGRLGEEKEVMPLVVYNGCLYGGTLPSGEVYRLDWDNTWTRVGQLDRTPDVPYRRVWSMAIYRGRLFAGTLPSGHVYSFEAGRNVTHDTELPAGWHHLAAVREGSILKLFVDGRRVAASAPFRAEDYDLSVAQPLRIGFGAQDYFYGRMSDLRLYGRALTEAEVAALAQVGQGQTTK